LVCISQVITRAVSTLPSVAGRSFLATAAAGVRLEYPVLWFESFARLVNSDMNNGIEVSSYHRVFEFLRKQYVLGDDGAKEIIDVSIIENLFWQVVPSRAKIYWDLPAMFKDLYVEFHGKPPA